MALNTFNIDITAKKAGTTNIVVKAQAENGQEVTKTIAVTVKDKTVLTPSEDVSNPISMIIGAEPKKITFTTNATSLTVENTAEQFVKGEIDADDSTGKTVKISAIAAGNGKVIVKATKDGKAEATVEISVVVADKQVTTELTLDIETIELAVGDVKVVKATTNASDITVTSESDETATAVKAVSAPEGDK